MFVDSHIYLTHHLFDGEVPCIDSAKSDDRIIDKDRDALMNAIKDAGVEFCIEPGIELESNDKILQYAKHSGSISFKKCFSFPFCRLRMTTINMCFAVGSPSSSTISAHVTPRLNFFINISDTSSGFSVTI